MNKKRLFQTADVVRQNPFMTAGIGLILSLSSLFQAVLEVFLRRHFGYRYFSGGKLLVLLLLLLGLPFGLSILLNGKQFTPEANLQTITWYGFAALFFYFGLRRLREMRRAPGLFDLTHYSLYSGKIYNIFYAIPVFRLRATRCIRIRIFERILHQRGRRRYILTYKNWLRFRFLFFDLRIKFIESRRRVSLDLALPAGLRLKRREANIREIETRFEPMPFLLAGLGLSAAGLWLGLLLVWCAGLYILGNNIRYSMGIEVVFDQIDNILVNRDAKEVFINGNEENGLRIRALTPESKTKRREVWAQFFSEEEIIDVH